MQKMLGKAFAEKCSELLRADGASIHSVARKLKCSPSTVYRATGGRRRALAGSTLGWAEKERKARTKTGKRRSVGASSAARSKGRRATGVRGLPKNRKAQQAANRRRSEKAAKIARQRAAMNAAE